MSGYEELTLEELSQVFTEETHAPLAASDMRDWLIALGAALGKKRLADKANAWSKWITGEYSADAHSDVAGMGVADLLAAGMPKADAKVVFKHLNGRIVEDGDSVAASGVTTPGGSNASDTVSEIAASMSQGMANAARSAMEKVAARSKVAPLKELSGIQPTVKDVQGFGHHIVQQRRRVASKLVAVVSEISLYPWKYLTDKDVLSARIERVVEDIDSGAELDEELYSDIMEAIPAKLQEELGDSHESGVYLYFEIMERAVKRPFDLIAPSMKYACEDVPVCTWAGYLQEDLQKWVEAVQEVRFRNDLGDYTTIMQGLAQLLGQQQPTLIHVLGHWNSTKKRHADFDDVMRELETTAAACKQKAEMAQKGKGQPKGKGKGQGRGRGRGRAGGSVRPTGRAARQAGPDADKPCHDFRDHGECRFGDDCKFSHDVQQTVPRAARAAHRQQKQSARYMVAEGATSHDAEVVMADNAKLRARIAELEGVRRDRGKKIGVPGVPGDVGDKNGKGKNLRFSESCTGKSSDTSHNPNRVINDADAQQQTVQNGHDIKTVKFSETSTPNVHVAKNRHSRMRVLYTSARPVKQAAAVQEHNRWQVLQDDEVGLQQGVVAQTHHVRRHGKVYRRQHTVHRRKQTRKGCVAGERHSVSRVLERAWQHRSRLRSRQQDADVQPVKRRLQMISRHTVSCKGMVLRTRMRHVLPKVESTRKKKKKRRPDYRDKLVKKLQATRAAEGYEGVRQGPILDGAATTSVIGCRDAKHAYNVQDLPEPVVVDGIWGANKVYKTGSLKCGDFTIHKGLVMPQAQESVVASHELCMQNCGIWQDSDGACVYDKGTGKVYECPADGVVYRLPTAAIDSAAVPWEMELARQKSYKIRQHRQKTVTMAHHFDLHMPKDPLCDVCTEAKSKRNTKQPKLDRPQFGNGEVLDIGIDLVGPLQTDVDGNQWVLNGVEVKHGLGAARASPGKSVVQLLPLVKEIVAEIRAHCGLGQQVMLRLHSDIDQSLMGEITAWVQSQSGIRTTTEGYDHDGNAFVESRNAKMKQTMRACLLGATGGRKQYEEIAIPACLHACLLYTSPSPRDKRQSRMPSSA